MQNTPLPDVYFDDFSNWNDVSQSFDVKLPEPDEVLLAAYTYEDYSGAALVIYRIGDKFYVVEGGHCSCYGLEGQWEPEEYSLPLLFAAFEKRTDNYSVWGQHHKRILQNLRNRIVAEGSV
jgi:hypothetical protein